MAQFFEGDTNMFHAAIFAEPDFNTIDFLSNQYKNVSQFLTDKSSQFFKAAETTFQQLTGSDAIRTARAAARKIKNMWDEDDIRPLKTIDQFQFAKPTMQRYVMAMPDLRSMYHQQRVDGYSESYRDLEPGSVGEKHSDYRRVMTGVVVETENGFHSVTYYDEKTDERDLSLEEKSDIIDTWEKLAEVIRKGRDDPTSIWCSQLG